MLKRFLIAALFITASYSANADVFLKSSTSITGEYINLSDLFTGIGKDKDARVTLAPNPGKTAVFDASTLEQIAKKNSLDWKASADDKTVVKREAHIINTEEIIGALKAHPSFSNMASQSDEVVIKNSLKTFMVPVDISYSISANDVIFDGKDFRADVSVVSDGKTLDNAKVIGRISAITAVPVLNRNMGIGSIITSSDIEYAYVREDAIRTQSIIDKDMLVGKEAKRNLKAYAIISQEEVKSPVLVKKSKQVTVVYRKKNMSLSATAKALDNGSLGDVIRIQSPNNTNILQGVVTGYNSVEVGREIALSNAEGRR